MIIIIIIIIHWIVEIKADLVKYFELHILRTVLMVLLHPTHSLTMDTASTEVFANFLLVSMAVCFALFSLFLFHFLSMLCGTQKKKTNANTVQLRYLHYSFGRLAIAVRYVNVLLFVFVHFFRFHYLFFTMSITAKTNISNKKNCNLRNALNRLNSTEM